MTREGGVSTRRPASTFQDWVLRMARLLPDVVTSPRQTVSIAVRVRGPLDVDALDAAFDTFVARHEVLRTRLVTGAPEGEVGAGAAGRVWQEVEPHRPAALEREAEPLAGEAAEMAAAARWARREVPFDEPPLVRGFVAPCAGDRGAGDRVGPGGCAGAGPHHLVGLTLHHMAADAGSLAIAMRDLAACYSARLRGEAPAALPLQYGAYAAWQRRRLAPRRDADRRAGAAAFAGIEPPRYRRDVPFQPGRRAAARELRATLLAPAEVEAVAGWSWRHRSTMFCSLLAAFARTCAGWTDSRDLPIGTLFEQRDHPAARHLVGPFVYATMLRLRVEDGEPWAAFTARVRAVVADAYARAQAPALGFLVPAPRLLPGAIGIEPAWYRTFQYLPADPAPAFAFGDATGELVATAGPRTDPHAHERGVHLRVRRDARGALVGRLGYDSNELRAASAEALLAEWSAAVRDLIRSG